MPVTPINALTLKHWLDDGSVRLVDVREPAEYDAEHIPGAALQPLSTVTDAAWESGEMKLAFHCKAGRRGQEACQRLLAQDPALTLYHLEGGIEAWKQAGFATVTSGRRILPLDRQVQLVIGLILLAAVTLGYAVHPGFFLICAMLGLGLTNAGLTGWCGLALMLARMPWNQRVTSKK